LSEPRVTTSEDSSWRELLLRRLLVATTPIVGAAVLMALAATHDRNQLLIALLLPVLPLQAAGAIKTSWSFDVRASILIWPLVFAACLVYRLTGFKGNASLVAAAAVVLAGLLFGRRRMLLVLTILLLAPISMAVGTLAGLVHTDDLVDLSITSVKPWVRTTFVSIAIWSILGLAVTFVVQHIESALAATQRSLLQLRLEQARREQAEHLQRRAQEAAVQGQKMEIVARLASGAAHDFNNLLGVVGGWAELALADAADSERTREAREEIHGALQQGRSLTSQLMALARPHQRVVTRIDMSLAAKTSVATLARVMPVGVALSFEARASALVEADATELQQLLFNLVLNARDALPNGGTIRVTCDIETTTSSTSVAGAALAPGRWATLRVEDSGAGIDIALRDKIFELFFTTKPVGLGTGLGLATVLRIAQHSGGGIALESEPGRGAAFTLYLPCAV